MNNDNHMVSKVVDVKGFITKEPDVFRRDGIFHQSRASILQNSFVVARMQGKDICIGFERIVFNYSKPVYNDHSKKDQKLVFKTNCLLMQVKRGAFCNTFDLH